MRRSILVAAMALVWLAGCSIPDRGPAPPAAAMLSADIPGIPNARYWPESEIEPLAAMIERADQRLSASGVGAKAGGRWATPILALSGGSDRGAFGAGLLVGWTEHGDRPEFVVVTGTSTGALIAPFAFLGPEYDAVLREVYTTITADDVFTRRPFSSFLFNDALADTGPLQQMIADRVDAELLRRIAEEYDRGRLLLVGTTNLDAGQQIIWDIGAIAKSGHPDAVRLVRDVVLASASIPGSFPPVMIDVELGGERYQEMHVDGGVAAQVFIYPPSFDLRSFIEALGEDADISLFVIRNARLTSEFRQIERRTSSIVVRSTSAIIRSQGVGDLYTIFVQASRDDAAFNLAYIPDEFDLPRGEPFDPDYMAALFDFAYQRARNGYPWLDRPPGFVGPELRRMTDDAR